MTTRLQGLAAVLAYIQTDRIKTAFYRDKEVNTRFKPVQFKEKFPTTRMIINCTEIRFQMHTSLLLNSQLNSS